MQSSAKADEVVRSSRSSIVDEFAKNVHVDSESEGDIEYSLLNDLVNAFGANPVIARRAMRELLARSPGKFYSSALGILKAGHPGPGRIFLNSLLLENDLLLAALADANAFNASTAVLLAKNLYRMDPQFDAKLLRQVLRDDNASRGESDYSGLERVLAIIDAVSDCKRLVPTLMKLQGHRSPHIRSKVALLLVRAHRNADWYSQLLGNEDHRVRANAIEGLLDTMPGKKEIDLLWQATKDSHHRVVINALVVLVKNGHMEAQDELLHLVNHPSEMFRAAAAWGLGEIGNPDHLEVLQKMALTDTGAAKRMALKSSVLIRKKMQAAPAQERENV